MTAKSYIETLEERVCREEVDYNSAKTAQKERQQAGAAKLYHHSLPFMLNALPRDRWQSGSLKISQDNIYRYLYNCGTLVLKVYLNASVVEYCAGATWENEFARWKTSVENEMNALKIRAANLRGRTGTLNKSCGHSGACSCSC
jgi:hypothetical protein